MNDLPANSNIDNSENYRKGMRTESVFKYILSTKGYLVERPKDRTNPLTSRVDFRVVQPKINRTFYAEVKYQKSSSVTNKNIPVFFFKKSVTDIVQNFKDNTGNITYLAIVDTAARTIFWRKIEELYAPRTFYGETFPLRFPVEDDEAKDEWINFAVRSFEVAATLSQEQIDFIENDQTETLDFTPKKFSYPATNPVPADVPKNDAKDYRIILNGTFINSAVNTPDNGTIIGLKMPNDTVHYFPVYNLSKSLGYLCSAGGLKERETKKASEFIQGIILSGVAVYTIPHCKGGSYLLKITDVPAVLETFINLPYGTGSVSKKKQARAKAEKLKSFLENNYLNTPPPVKNTADTQPTLFSAQNNFSPPKDEYFTQKDVETLLKLKSTLEDADFDKSQTFPLAVNLMKQKTGKDFSFLQKLLFG